MPVPATIVDQHDVPAAWPMSRILSNAKRWRAQRRLYCRRRCWKCSELDAEPMYHTCMRVYRSQLTSDVLLYTVDRAVTVQHVMNSKGNLDMQTSDFSTQV